MSNFFQKKKMRYSFSIVCVFNNRQILEAHLLKSLKKQNFSYELILLDNTNSRYKSAAEALNIGGRKAKGEFIIFVHQDVEFVLTGWLLQAYKILNNLPKLGVAGVAGIKEEGYKLISNGTHGVSPKLISVNNLTGDFEEVLSLDECLVIVRSDLFIKQEFDEKICDDWHLYVAEYCYRQKKTNLCNYVISLPIHHNSTGLLVLSSFSNKFSGYFKVLKKILKKYSGDHSMFTSSTGIWSTDRPILFQRIYYLIYFNYSLISQRIKNLRLEKIFFIFGLIFGLIFSIITPPFQVADESTHFYKILNITNGRILSEKKGNEIGVYVSKNSIETVNSFEEIPFNPEKKVQINKILSLLKIPFKAEEKEFVDISKTFIVSYPPFPYIFPAISVFLLKPFNLSPELMMYFGRFINLVVYLFFAYTAIKIIPFLKRVLLLLALMPMTLFQAASLSADSLAIGASFLAIAFILEISFSDIKQKIKKMDMFILSLLFIVLALSKSFYCLLILLFFIIPTSKFKDWKEKILYFLLFFSSVCLPVFYWNLLSSGLYKIPGLETKIRSILLHPLDFLVIFLKTIFINFIDYLSMFVGKLGWLDTALPIWLIALYLLTLVFFSFFDQSDKKINDRQKIISFSIFIIISASIFLLEFLTWTPIDSSIILGVQGRYFIPFALLFFLIFYGYRNNFLENNKKEFIFNLFSIVFIFLTSLITVFVLIERYYII